LRVFSRSSRIPNSCNQESHIRRHNCVGRAENRYDLASTRNVRCIAIVVTFVKGKHGMKIHTYNHNCKRVLTAGNEIRSVRVLRILDESNQQSTITSRTQSAARCTDNRKSAASITEAALDVTRTVTMETEGERIRGKNEKSD